LSKLKLLVPAVGIFFTPLSLHDAFVYQDGRRFISRRRFVAPSFNDIRLVLNTSQIMSLARTGPLELVTFDGDVTLYEDGKSLEPDSPVIPRMLALLRRGIRIGVVTAAGVWHDSQVISDTDPGTVHASEPLLRKTAWLAQRRSRFRSSSHAKAKLDGIRRGSQLSLQIL
jgi:hypothetical protein